MKGKDKTLPAVNETAVQPETTAKKPGKLFIILSYTLALISLIAALFVPIFYGKMFIQILLAAVAPIVKLFGVEIPASAYGTFFISGKMPIAQNVIYLGIIVATLLALIMLIPVIAGKARKGTNLRCAFAAEFIAFNFVNAYLIYEMLNFIGTWQDWALLIPLGVIALVMAAQSIKYKGGLGVAKFIIFLLAMLTLFTLFDIVAFIPVLESPFNSLAGLIGAEGASFIDANTNGFNFVYFIKYLCDGTFSFADPAQTGLFIRQLMNLIVPAVITISVILDYIGLIAGNKTRKNGEPNPHKGWFVIAAIRYSLIILLIAACVVLSFVLSGFGKVGIYIYLSAIFVLLAFIVEIVRYCVGKSKLKAYKAEQYEIFKNEKLVIQDDSLVENKDEEGLDQPVEGGEYQTNMFGDEPAVQALPVVDAVEEQPTESVGEQLSILDAQSVDETVEPVVVDAAEVEIEDTAEEKTAEETVKAEETPVQEEVAVKVEETPVQAVEAVETAEEVQEAEVVEEVEPAPTVNLFGETIESEKAKEEKKSIDPFIDKLTDEERAQFFDVFVNRNQGKFTSIPVYRLNENNADFFPSVFVHINRMRDLCSDSLLAKIYREIGKE
ncbi:MAG: hypothetical protein ACI4QN_04675 [Candidatus Coproplasma sp.]